AGAQQCGNLIAPVAAMAEAAMEQDNGRSGPAGGIPDPRPVMLVFTYRRCAGQGCLPIRLELCKVVVVHLSFALQPLGVHPNVAAQISIGCESANRPDQDRPSILTLSPVSVI